MSEFSDNCPDLWIIDAYAKTKRQLELHDVIVVSVSGGADSDIVIDLLSRIKTDKKIIYVFFNTGFEYKATLEHLDYLERKYNIKIHRERAVKPIPLACKEYGVPFLSKYVSEMIMRLQKHGFKWEDKPYEELVKEYPNCKGALKWWTNSNVRKDGKIGTLNIARDKWLKEFLIENPPDFAISPKCCYYAKKLRAYRFVKEVSADLQITGIRKSEGGVRSNAYKNCFTPSDKCDYLRPIFWITNDVKKLYETTYNVKHSRCYTVYGLIRTGCAGCPFGSRFEEELRIIQKYEPQLYRAVIKVFGKSYEYTRRYREYAERRESEEVDKKV